MATVRLNTIEIFIMGPRLPRWSGDQSTQSLIDRFQTIRQNTTRLAEPLPFEDQVVQSMADASPTKWHLAHTTWFFETFLLHRFVDDYQPFRAGFEFLFNSYYQGAGPQFSRAHRGTIGRPTVAEVQAYRRHVDAAILQFIGDAPRQAPWEAILEVGLNHEQQHQELLLTDIKHALAANPLRPAYRSDLASSVDSAHWAPDRSAAPQDWLSIAGDIHRLGYDGPDFCFDNEQPRHRVFIEPCQITSRPVSCGEFMEFIDDGGYADPKWWLSLGWEARKANDWEAPLYWERRDDQWWTMTLGGMRCVDRAEPVCHVSYFEADAYARWAGASLPTEAQWEVACGDKDDDANFVGTDRLQPRPMTGRSHHFFGDVWEWTASAYSAYPGFSPWPDTLGEYNGKFMCNQFVLRGGSCVSAADHLRKTYRNFFAPDARWQFTGFRLARSSA